MWKHAARWFRWAGIFAVGVFSWLGTLHAETHEAWDFENVAIGGLNPLEDNFRLYSVHDGHRRTLAGARIALPAGKWHSMTIVQHGDHYAGYLNGKKLLEGESALFPEAGGVGVWTKADAVTEFDDFSVSTR